MNIKHTALVAGTVIAMMAGATQVSAAKNDIGYDWSSYQGSYGLTSPNEKAKFAFSKVGGDGSSYVNPYYRTQVQSGAAIGLRMHSYLWFQDMTTYAQVDYYMARYLPMIQTPKGSIVALDVESGVTNNAVIKHAMQKIKDAGYTPMFYSYKPFIQSHNIDINGIGKKFGKNSIWIASYATMNVGQKPLFNYFPTMNNIGIWQYSSMGMPQGLDMNIDLSGDKNWSITESGYKNGNVTKPNTKPDAIKQAESSAKTPAKNIKVGMDIKILPGAKKYSTGQTIPASVKAAGYKVVQVEKNKVLLGGIYSWVNKSDIEIVNNNKKLAPKPKPAVKTVSFNGVYFVDSWQVHNGKWYARNLGMSIPVADYHNDIPVGAVTLTDRYGNKLRNQTAQGNNGRMEFFVLNGKHKVLSRSGSAVQVQINGESVWLKSAFAK